MVSGTKASSTEPQGILCLTRACAKEYNINKDNGKIKRITIENIS